MLGRCPVRRVRRVAVAVCPGGGRPVTYFTFRPGPAGVVEDDLVRGVHPMVGRRLNLWRLRDFASAGWRRPRTCCSTTAWHRTTSPTNDSSRWLRCASWRSCATTTGTSSSLPQAERAIAHCLEAIRRARTARGAAGAQLDMNHVFVHIWPVVDAPLEELAGLQRALAPLTVGRRYRGGRRAGPHRGARRFVCTPRQSGSATAGRESSPPVTGPPTERLAPLDDYAQKVLRARRRGTAYPYELVSLLAGPAGTFVEHDLDDTGALVPVSGRRAQQGRARRREWRRHADGRHPEGITRVVLLGDPTKALGAVAEAECARVDRRPRSGRAMRFRSSGSPCRPARGSRWTPAPRTWTGWPGRCAAS